MGTFNDPWQTTIDYQRPPKKPTVGRHPWHCLALARLHRYTSVGGATFGADVESRLHLAKAARSEV